MRFEHSMPRHGSPLYLFRMPHVESVAVGVLVFAGTRDEVWPKEAGIAHALEHMVFQGNTRLPNSEAISGEIELLGGQNNAHTSQEGTFFYCTVPANAFSVAVRWLGDLLGKPIFPEHKIGPEMSNIVSEIRGYNDDPTYLCSMKFTENVYGQHPLGRNVLGTEAAVSSFVQTDFRNFMERLYYPQNYTFVVVGNVKTPEAVRLFDQMFMPDTRRLSTRPKEGVPMSKVHEVYERDIE